MDGKAKESIVVCDPINEEEGQEDVVEGLFSLLFPFFYCPLHLSLQWLIHNSYGQEIAP